MIKGFFSLEDSEFPKKKPKKSSSSGTSRKKRVFGCEECGLFKNCKTPYMEPSGYGGRKILFLAEAPGAEEDKEGTQLIGEAGQLLREILEDLEFDLDVDGWKDNSVRCRPPKNREPKIKELNCCRVKVFKTIEELKLKPVLLRRY